MAFLEYPRLAPCYSFGARGGPQFSTEVNKTVGGQRYANANWLYPLHVFDISQGVKNRGRLREHPASFFYNVGGRRDGFRFKDWGDFKVGGGGQHPQAQPPRGRSPARLISSPCSTSPPAHVLAPIYKPVAGKVKVYRQRMGAVSLIAPTIDTTNGHVTVAGHMAGDTYVLEGRVRRSRRLRQRPARVRDRHRGRDGLARPVAFDPARGNPPVKTIPAELLNSESICACLRVERTDGVVMLFTSADRDVIVNTGNALFDGTYEAATGLGISNLVVQAGLAVDNMELPVLPDETTYPQVDILAGRWDNAKFRLFETDYRDPTRVSLLRRGSTGDADSLRTSEKFEFRSLKQALQQPVGAVVSKTCRARLGDAACRVDLAPWTHEYVVTAVMSRHVFVCSAADEVDDYYGDGIALSIDSQNDGYERKIKSFADGSFTLALEFAFPVEVGDSFRMVAGCRHRRPEDCRDKFDNVLNFQGEPDVPGADLLTARP